MIRAVGYCRVSSEDQAKSGISLPAQRAQLKAFCQARRWQLIEVLADEGISGKSMRNRPGLQAVLTMLQEHRADVLIITKLDRLSRSVRDIFALVEDEFASNGSSLVSIGENLDATTAMGKAFIGIIAVLAQMEREQIAERTKAALDHIKSTGRHLGRIAFGKKLDSGGRLVADRDAQNALRRARRMRASGASWREISGAMGWSMSQARTRLDPSYREKTRTAWAERRRVRRQ